MKTEKAIQVLRDYNLWRRGNEEMEQPDPREIGEAIDDVLMAVEKAEAERDLWRAEAQRWRKQALELEAQIETAIKRIQWRQDNLDRGIKELKGDY
jgi:predicted  nucleic acid-binding Zn-ribbon protein